MRKKRGYNRDTPKELVRDYKLFAIACEGNKTEPQYFNIFRYMSKRVAVDIIQDIVSEDEALSINPNKSAPKWVLDRALRYIEKEGLSEEDELWFVMDVDRWEESQLHEMAQHCKENSNWHLVLSNPCFETWLYFHKSKIIPTELTTCQSLKHAISTLEKGGYSHYKFITHLLNAIEHAKKTDQNPTHFFPTHQTTKVYQLAESFIQVIGKVGFQRFITNELPKLQNRESKLK